MRFLLLKTTILFQETLHNIANAREVNVSIASLPQNFSKNRYKIVLPSELFLLFSSMLNELQIILESGSFLNNFL